MIFIKTLILTTGIKVDPSVRDRQQPILPTRTKMDREEQAGILTANSIYDRHVTHWVV